LIVIAILNGPFEVFAHEGAFRENARQQEREEDGKPAVGREAGIEMERVRRSRNHLADPADHKAEKLQREERPGDRLQTGGVGGDERVALANGPNDREQPFEGGNGVASKRFDICTSAFPFRFFVASCLPD
jgi:hypothetical protein